MKFFSIILTVMVLSSTGFGQSTDDSVRAAIDQLFIAMRNADARILKNAFADSAILQTIIPDRTKGISIKNESVNDFAEFISKTAPGDADERIIFETIKIDGPLAMVWTPYHFYYKGKFSHCGVNSFQLIRINKEWKIQYLIDTRRKDGCKP